ncbi:hypothetical protein CFIMG_008272RA00001 [Ceratocystis fimbriata CBS 114723]|uniref:Uncharacterized protein n=1 Tax=Ceratocystis fimbriata CBS 114723 TaxID=1035309 RepID=A0A2C5WWB3_9PEZI|nr:hypothetical protein CFIMG_008272RA00001 [Ceratocystis fimbriata CBS 114723]
MVVACVLASGLPSVKGTAAMTVVSGVGVEDSSMGDRPAGELAGKSCNSSGDTVADMTAVSDDVGKLRSALLSGIVGTGSSGGSKFWLARASTSVLSTVTPPPTLYLSDGPAQLDTGVSGSSSSARSRLALRRAAAF